MNAKKAHILLIVLLLVVLAASVGSVVYADRWLKTRTANLVTLKTETIKLQQERAAYIRAKAILKKYQSTSDTLEKIIPKSKDQARAISELLDIAKENNIVVNSITFPASDLGTATKNTTTVAPTTTTTTSGTATPAPKAAAAVTQAKPVEGLDGILGIEVSLSNIVRVGGVSAEGISYDQLINFLKDLEQNRRTMQIKSVQVQPVKDDKSAAIIGYGLTLTLNIYVKP